MGRVTKYPDSLDLANWVKSWFRQNNSLISNSKQVCKYYATYEVLNCIVGSGTCLSNILVILHGKINMFQNEMVDILISND